MMKHEIWTNEEGLNFFVLQAHRGILLVNYWSQATD